MPIRFGFYLLKAYPFCADTTPVSNMRTGTTIFTYESQPVVVEGLIRVLENSADLKFAGHTHDIAEAIKSRRYLRTRGISF